MIGLAGIDLVAGTALLLPPAVPAGSGRGQNCFAIPLTEASLNTGLALDPTLDMRGDRTCMASACHMSRSVPPACPVFFCGGVAMIMRLGEGWW